MRHATSGTPQGSGATDPVRGATADAIDASLHWHVARTVPRMGTRALKALKEAEVATYLPRASEVVVRRGRRVVRRTPLLVRTVFIGVRDPDHLRLAQTQAGVAEIVAYPEEEGGPTGNVAGIVLRPARIDPDALQRFVNALALGEIVEPVGVKVGQGVIVREGPFATFPGVVEEILPNDRVRVGVAIFGRSTPVVLGIAEIQVV